MNNKLLIIALALPFSVVSNVLADKPSPQIDISTSITPVLKADSDQTGVSLSSADDSDCGCWVDAKTGKQVPTVPAGGENSALGAKDSGIAKFDPFNHRWAFDSKTDRDYVQTLDGCWIDDDTDEMVPTVPSSGANSFGGSADADGIVIIDPLNPNQAFNTKTGQTFVRAHCPPSLLSRLEAVKEASASMPDNFALNIGYAYLHADSETVKDLNGFTLSGFYKLRSSVALGAEFSGLFGNGTQHFLGGSTMTSLDRYLYLFGPQVTFQLLQRVKLVTEILVGGVSDYNYSRFMGGSFHSSGSAFAVAVGLSLQIQLLQNVSIGPSFDYILTNFNMPSGRDTQNNWRAGVEVRINIK